uniref:Uncharacterized protein n=1 Tax=Arundo donax TaxID=35708 RepID=A0A0A9F699_ARUDO
MHPASRLDQLNIQAQTADKYHHCYQWSKHFPALLQTAQCFAFGHRYRKLLDVAPGTSRASSLLNHHTLAQNKRGVQCQCPMTRSPAT